ncbi:DUF4377 domain-containing protein [Aquimarina sp. TRL1]|uniref:DUF4377 domain-containing protein n=1 Tax=Aquimarina sp. (strain TRL1) TaxID=2736252 RepID=UPI00158AC757|nr:DUF4377 domain-containing protein [Aquimarina sp. TRL1]QKX07061.1 DUF4377 domain-containing protein [Aquimarina sp. TRL1]
MNKVLTILFVFVFLGCASSKKVGKEEILWIHSAKVPCMGVAPMSCFSVKKEGTGVSQDWELFYDTIEGFSYEPGYLYKIKVGVTDIPVEMVPADASSVKYTLIRVISKEKDEGLRLSDSWKLIKLKETSIPKNAKPYMEINIAENKVFGMGGCNRFSGSIQKATKTQLQLGPMMSTKMLCEQADMEHQFFRALEEVMSYRIENNKLYLLDANQKEILILAKLL